MTRSGSDVCFSPHCGLNSDIAACPKSAKTGSGEYKSRKEKAARRRLLNSNPIIVDQAAINASFAFRR